MTTAQHLYFDGPKPGEHQHISPLKAKKLASENLQLKKNILTQEFKEAHRERIIQSSNENNAVKGQEHKLRQALDAFISENKTKNDKLNEMQIRLEIMKRDDLSGQEVNEKEIEEEIEKNIGMRGLESARKWRASSSDKGKALIEKFIFVKKVLEKLIEKKEEEDEMRRILEAKITQLKLDQKIMNERNGKRENLYNMMQKRFVDLETVENRARNKLTRTSNKLFSLRKSMERQKSRENEYFAQKKNVFNRSHSTLEGLKETAAKNIIYMEETRVKKNDLDEKLEELTYEEKQIMSKRQSSEYILLYIELLETLENEFMKAVPKGSINLDQSITKLGRGVSLGPEDSYQREGLEEANHTLRSISKDERRTNLNITARDRDVIITRIAQFYDSHSQGTDALVSDLLRMFNDLQLKEQSLGLRHHELNEERLRRKKCAETLAKNVKSLQESFILMDDSEDSAAEDASPEHVRENEKKVIGKLGQYDHKAVAFAEYLVNICSTGIQNTLLKLKNASNALTTKAEKLGSIEIMAKAREIEGFFSKPKEYTTQEAPRGRKSFLKPPTQDETSPISLFRPQAMGRKYSNSKSPTVKEENSNYLSPFVSTQNKPIETLSPRENTSFSQKNDQLTEKEMSYKSEERGVQPSQALTQEIAAVEQLFKSQLDALPEIVHIWGEKFLEEKWLLDYLSKEEIKRILQKFKQHQGNQVTENILNNIFRDLKNEARLAQRKKTAEIFAHIESLLILYLKQYSIRKQQIQQKYHVQIKSEILDSPIKILAISEHVDEVHKNRIKKIPFQELTTENDEEGKQESSPTAGSEGDLESLGGAHSPKEQQIFSAREVIETLHLKFMQERRKTAQIQYPRSSSVPKIRVAFMKKKGDNSTSLLDDDENTQKLNLKARNNGTFDNGKKGLPVTRPRTGTNSSAIMPHIKAEHGEFMDERRTRRMIETKRIPQTERSERVGHVRNSFTSHSKKRSNTEEEFLKKIIRDDELIKKITILEKRNTVFDKKSSDCDRRKDYVPNFTMLGKFGLSREKSKNQTISEWWGQSDVRLSMLLEKERQETKIIPTSPEKKEINLQVSHSHDKRREAPSVKKFFFESRRSASKPVMRTWLKPDKTTYTLRPDTRQSFSRAKVKRKESFDTYEDKIYNEAVSQSSRLMGL